MDMSLTEFLTGRRISEETIQYIIEERIDTSTILIMEEKALKDLFRRLGDRIAIKNFCQKKEDPKKCSLIEKLKRKFEFKNKTHSDAFNEPSTSGGISKKHRKMTRNVELGLMAYCETRNQMVQIKMNKGGGTRKVSVNRSSKTPDLLDLAKELFFPNNKSSIGHADNFTFKLLDFCKNEVDTNLTVEEIYEATRVNKLRFYLAAVKKDEIEDHNQEVLYENYDSIVDFLDTSYEPYVDESPSTTQQEQNVVATQESSSPRRSERLGNQTNASQYILDFIEEELLPDLGPTILVIHRGKVFDELLLAFKTHIDINELQIEMILPNGEKESAEDMGGVMRDALTEFWQTFYDKCTVGTCLKVPCLRDDFGEPEWQAVCRILAKGWQTQKYFPISLAPTFIKNCLQQPIEEEDLMKDFFKFVAYSESELIKGALQDFSSVDTDELMEFLGNYDVKRMVTQDNIRDVLKGIAEKEIIQKPEFVAKCFFKTGQLNRIKDIPTLYAKLEPTARNIISHLEIKNEFITPAMENVLSYLKRFIRETNDTLRSAFLRFVTGSDLVTRKIGIQFIDLDGLKRSPIAHTCSYLVEFPHTYPDYMTLRSEMNYLLSSNIWVMDII